MASVLERAASAPRPAGPPAMMHASTSRSTPCSGWHHRSAHRRRPCALTRQQQVLSQQDGWHPPAPAAFAVGTSLHTSNLDAALRSASQPASPQQPHTPGRSSSSRGVASQGGAPPNSAFLMTIICGSFLGRVPASFLDAELEPVAGQHPGAPALDTLRSIYSRHPGAFTAAHTAAALERLVDLGEETQDSANSSSSSSSRYQRGRSRQRQRSFSTLSFNTAASELGAQLLGRFHHQLGTAAPRDVAAALCAAAWLGLTLPQGLVEDLAAAAAGPALQSYTPQHLSRLMWALAKMQQAPPAWWLAQVVAEVGRGVAGSKWQQQSIAMALWALGTWQVDMEQLLGGPGATTPAGRHGGSGHVSPPGATSSSSNSSGNGSGSSSSSVNVINNDTVSSSSSGGAGAAWWSSFWAATQPALPTWTPQHLSMVLAAAARLRQAPPQAWLQQWQGALLSHPQQQLPSGPQHQHTSHGLSQAAWALASLGLMPPGTWRAQLWAASEPLLLEAEAQHLALLVWAAATWGAAEGASPAAGSGGQGVSVAAPAYIVQAAAAVAGQGAGATLAAAAPIAGQAVSLAVTRGELQGSVSEGDASAQEAVVDSSGAPPGSWQQLLWPSLLRGSAQLDPHALSLLTWGGARLGWPLPPGLRKGLVGAVEDLAEEGDPHSTALLCYGCSRMGVRLEPRAFSRLLRRLHHHLPRLSPQGLVLAVQGLAGLAGRGSGCVAGQPEGRRRLPGHISADLLAACQAYLTPGAGVGDGPTTTSSSSNSEGRVAARRLFTAEELPGLLLGLARLQLLPDGGWLAAAEAALLPALPAYTPKQLSLVLFSLGRLRHAPSPDLTAAASSRWSEVQGAAGAQDCGLALHGGVALGWREVLPAGWWMGLLARCEQVFPSAGHAPLSMMVWAAAQLPQRPSPSWLAACLATSQQHLPASSLLSIATQLAALQALEYLPPANWMALAFATATSRLRDQGILLGEDGVAVTAAGQPPPAAVRYQMQPTWGARWGAGGAEGGWTLRSRRCVRLLREGAAWYQAHARPSVPSPGLGGVEAGQQPGLEGAQEAETLLGVWRRRLQGAAATASTDAAIAAAVGVAAAVARQHLGY